MKWIYWTHRVTGLISAPFLLLLCLTGAILLFGEEISDWNAVSSAEYEAMGEEALYRHLPEAMAKTETEGAGQTIESIRFMPFAGRIRIRFEKGDSPDALRLLDLHLKDGALQEVLPRAYRYAWVGDTMRLMMRLHVRLNAGYTGEIFLVCICALTMVSIGTGFWLYPAFMKGIPFGVRRRFSRRLWWSDWHKALGILAGGWLCILSLSGVGLFLYEQESAEYNEAAWSAAQAQFSAAAGETIPVDRAVEHVRRAASDQSILSMLLPDAKRPFYAFEIADMSSGANPYAPRQWAFMAADGSGSLLIPPPSDGLLWSLLFVKLHFYNHDLLPLKGMWGFFLLLSVLLTVSGAVAYMARFFTKSKSRSKESVLPLVHIHRYGVWSLAILPVLGLFLPLWGAPWMAFGVFGYTAFGALCLMKRK